MVRAIPVSARPSAAPTTLVASSTAGTHTVVFSLTALQPVPVTLKLPHDQCSGHSKSELARNSQRPCCRRSIAPGIPGGNVLGNPFDHGYDDGHATSLGA
jgi:hypothetical protein